MENLLLLLLFWMLFGMWGYKIGTAKGYSGVESFIVGVLLGPFTVLLYAASNKGKKCPHCGEMIKTEAEVCRFCHSHLSDESRKAA